MFQSEVQSNRRLGLWQELPFGFADSLQIPATRFAYDAAEFEAAFDVPAAVESHPTAHRARSAEIAVADAIQGVSKLQAVPSIRRLESWKSFLGRAFLAAPEEIGERNVKSLESCVYKDGWNIGMLLFAVHLAMRKKIQMLFLFPIVIVQFLKARIVKLSREPQLQP